VVESKAGNVYYNNLFFRSDAVFTVNAVTSMTLSSPGYG